MDHQADADDEPAMKAILAGMKKRHEKTGDTPILIHLVSTHTSCEVMCP